MFDQEYIFAQFTGIKLASPQAAWAKQIFKGKSVVFHFCEGTELTFAQLIG